MKTLSIFKTTAVNSLGASISDHRSNYLRPDVWVREVAPHSSLEMPTSVLLIDPLILELPSENSYKDFENAVRLHKTLISLTPLQARDPRLWTRLAHVEFWEYMRVRWPVERHMEKGDKALRFIGTRYFVLQSQGRALLRHGIARLWWTAQLSHDPGRHDPYELTNVLLSSLDITQQILERSLGRADSVLKGFLELLLLRRDLLLAGGNQNRERIRLLAKFLNMHGGVCILDTLSRADMLNVLDKRLTKILEAEDHGSGAIEEL